ncbi:MAG: hypothetical protein ACRBN8_12775 [Nannocystales bacterium]
MLEVVVSIAVALASLGPVDDAIDRARTQASSGDLEAAIETIRSARVQHDDPDLLYVEAQLQRISNNCASAVPLYEAFLATDPPDEDRVEVDRNLSECRDELGVAEPVPLPPVEPPPPVLVDPPAESEPGPAEPAPAAQGPDRLGLALWISGGILVAGGAATYGGAWGLRARRDAGDPTLDTYLEREQTAGTLSGVGIALAATGAAVLLGATIRHVLRRR